MRALLVAPLLVIISTSLSAQELTREEFDANRSLWSSRIPDNYTYILLQECFCSFEVLRPVELEIRESEIESVTFADTQLPYNSTVARHFPTINELFDKLQGYLDSRDRYEAFGLDVTVHADFDVTFGYPTDIFFDIQALVDEEVRWVARELTIIPEPASTGLFVLGIAHLFFHRSLNSRGYIEP